MSTIADRLTTLNKLRKRDGQSMLKSWKKSGDLLDQAIDELDAKLRPAPKPIPPKSNDKPKGTTHPAKLARGLETDTMSRMCRESIRMAKAKDKRERDKIKLSKADRKQLRDEAKSRRKDIAGAIDPKRDPEGAKRQAAHVERKRAERAKRTKKPDNPNETTVADIARDIGMTPKVARAKLRRHEDKLTSLRDPGMGRWTFPKSAHSTIVNILKGVK